ncbi:MAG: thiamine-phosphate kinase [Robiginitomaculum sp.]|nr:thiamine-phosphate kinase [Robiginitomaculum sp.]
MKPSEFGFIGQLAEFASQAPESLFLQDDGAIISCEKNRLVVVKDLVQAGVHTLENDSLCDIVRKAILVNLSDLAAMGARPKFILLGLCLDKNIDPEQLTPVAETIRVECDKYSIALIGGDTVIGLGPTTVSVTAIGELVSNPILRSGAKIGDDVWVTDNIGDAALGLRLLQADADSNEFSCLGAGLRSTITEKYYSPSPRIELGMNLSGIANSLIDISDGLFADAGHIASTSKVSLQLDLSSVPLSPAFVQWSEHVDNLDTMLSVLAGGDDYELLFTAPIQHRQQIQNMGAKLSVKTSKIGTVIAGGEVVVTNGQTTINTSSTGFTHF